MEWGVKHLGGERNQKFSDWGEINQAHSDGGVGDKYFQVYFPYIKMSDILCVECCVTPSKFVWNRIENKE